MSDVITTTLDALISELQQLREAAAEEREVTSEAVHEFLAGLPSYEAESFVGELVNDYGDATEIAREVIRDGEFSAYDLIDLTNDDDGFVQELRDRGSLPDTRDAAETLYDAANRLNDLGSTSLNDAPDEAQSIAAAVREAAESLDR